MADSSNTPKAPSTLPFSFVPQEPETAVENNPHEKASSQVGDVMDALQAHLGDDFHELVVYAGEHTARVANERLLDACAFLKDEKGFAYLADIGGIDRFTEDDRYEVFYNLVNIEDGKRLRLVIRVDEDSMTAQTVTDVYPAANWNERECYDMFGIRFEGHPDLRRMYMPEDFEYYPLRKEFPLLGVPGSLPLPPQAPTGDLTEDPFPAAHGHKPPKSFEEIKSEEDND